MKERVCRDGDENLYQPKIHSDRIKELYIIGQETGLPLTVLVYYAIRSYVDAYQEEKRKREYLDDEVAWKLDSEHDEDFEIQSLDDFEDLSTYLDPYGEDY